jgi:hypothetical protein
MIFTKPLVVSCCDASEANPIWPPDQFSAELGANKTEPAPVSVETLVRFITPEMVASCAFDTVLLILIVDPALAVNVPLLLTVPPVFQVALLLTSIPPEPTFKVPLPATKLVLPVIKTPLMDCKVLT